jgi:hypothetical protein
MVRSNLREFTILNHGAGLAPKASLGILLDTMFSHKNVNYYKYEQLQHKCFPFLGWNYAKFRPEKYDFNLYKGFFMEKLTQIC